MDQVTVYNQIDVDAEHSAELDCLRRREIEYVTLTSPNIARGFAQLLDGTCRTRIANGEIQLVSISPVTSAAVREI